QRANQVEDRQESQQANHLVAQVVHPQASQQVSHLANPKAQTSAKGAK
ncbi:MAG: hypothetical protein ACI84R_002804, partial [Candidatus Azotimanducaceae bacterium]